MREAQRDFAGFYAGCRDDCLRVVLASTGDPALDEELVAEAFTLAWVSWKSVGRHPAPQAWVIRTALNTRVSWWRRRRREIPYEGQDVAVADKAGAVDATFMRALLKLPARQREVIALRVFLDRPATSTASSRPPATPRPPAAGGRGRCRRRAGRRGAGLRHARVLPAGFADRQRCSRPW